MGKSGTYGGKPKPHGKHTKVKPLNEQQTKFVEEYLRTGSTKGAAIFAGYAGAEGQHGSQIGNQVKRATSVHAAIEASRAKVAEKGAYALEQAMAEADEAIQFSRETENANAFVKAVELKAKLNGLIDKDKGAAGVPLQIIIQGIERDIVTLPPAIDIPRIQRPEEP